MNVVVLGAGRVGSAIARDLASDAGLTVTVIDRSTEALGALEGVGPALRRCDLADARSVTVAVAGQDLAVVAVPGFLGFQTVKATLEADLDVVDISFSPEDPYALDDLARSRGRLAVVDCGVAPGCSNLILGRLEVRMDRVDAFQCLVGGLPVERRGPWEYRAPFSPVDVIEEYTRPVRTRRNGVDLTLPPLSEVERVVIPGLGTLEAFNTDGLRTLLRNSRAATLSEKTLRYPGHAERVGVLANAGFFSDRPVEVEGTMVRPRSLTARLLFDAWRYRPGEEDLTVMRVTVDGAEGGAPVRHVVDLLDRYDPATETSSMARTTGYTCTAMVRLVASGRLDERGVLAPEVVARDEDCYESVMEDLAARGIRFRHRIEERPEGS